MRAWTIMLFLLALQMSLYIFTAYNPITDVYQELNITIDKTGFGSTELNIMNVSFMRPNSQFFYLNITALSQAQAQAASRNMTTTDVNKNNLVSMDNAGTGTDSSPLSPVLNMISQVTVITGFFGTLISFAIGTVTIVYFLTAGIFGSLVAFMLQLICNVIIAIGFIQIVTGRAFKTME